MWGMGICWYCHWGWPEPVAAIYREAVAALAGDDYPLRSGPSHVVWEDENFDDYGVRLCLERCSREDPSTEDVSDAALEVVRRSLEALLALPESIRCPEPEDYDDAHPEHYPPPSGVVMVRR